MPLPNGVLEPTDAFPWPQLPMDTGKLQALTSSLINAGVKYGLGKKAEPLGLQAGEFDRIDCSGFFRWVIYHACNHLVIPDGSANQHQWFEVNGFKQSDFHAALANDGILRVAFLSPQDSNEHIGHVLMILNGRCFESHGSTGPDDQRMWGSKGWQNAMTLFVVKIA